MTNTHVDMSRYGGEMKLNLWQDAVLAPYITLGGGVHEFKYQLASATDPKVMDDMKEEQLFAAVGLGTKINLSDRVVLSLEAKNTILNVNDKSYYLSPEYVMKESGNRLYNWSALASLDFYLGGDNRDRNALSRAYHNMFTDGFTGLKFVVEPGGAYVNFNDESLFPDQFFLGGSAGFDFSSLVGIRGFYYQATQQPDKLSFDFNDQLAMYGGNIIARLNYPRGVNPYLQLGAGYLKVGETYQDIQGLNRAKSTPFAFGGLGLEIPLSRYLAVYGNINAMLTSQDEFDVDKLLTPSQVKTNLMYQAGVRVNLGRAANGDAIYADRMDKVTADRELQNQQINDMRAEYEERINKLNAELDEANLRHDTQAASQILEEKRRAEDVLDGMETTTNGERLVRMTSADFDNLVSRVIREVRGGNYNYDNNQAAPAPQYYYPNNAPAAPAAPANADLSRQIEEMNAKLDRSIEQMNRSKNETIVISDGNNAPQAPIVMAPQGGYGYNTPNNANTNQPAALTGNSRFKWNRLSAFTGVGFGDLTAWNVGVRGYMQISGTNLDFVPEFYAALGSKSGLGLSGNVVYNISNLNLGRFNPYVGLGLGVYHGEKAHVGSNIILGGMMNLGSGNLFVDYSVRSLFKQNQLAVGYQFVF